MTGIDRIGPSGPQGTSRPERASGAAPTPKSFELRTADTAGPSAPTADGRGAAARVCKLIDAGLAQGLSRDEVLESVVASGIERGFGPLASPELRQAVTRAIDDNPAARELFDRLYARAVQARG